MLVPNVAIKKNINTYVVAPIYNLVYGLTVKLRLHESQGGHDF